MLSRYSKHVPKPATQTIPELNLSDGQKKPREAYQSLMGCTSEINCFAGEYLQGLRAARLGLGAREKFCGPNCGPIADLQIRLYSVVDSG